MPAVEEQLPKLETPACRWKDRQGPDGAKGGSHPQTLPEEISEYQRQRINSRGGKRT